MSETTRVGSFKMEVEHQSGYEFLVRFDKEHYAPLRMDEPAPLGKDEAPNPARILAAAIADCLSASLLFCMHKQGKAPDGLRASVEVELVRNAERRLRIGVIDVKLVPRIAGDQASLDACLERFEDFCVVTQSVREGLDVRVHVEPERVG